MNRCFLIIITVFFVNASFSQSDFFQLKKRDKVLKTWYKDNDIYFQLGNGQWITAVIHKIQDDSLYLRPYQVQTFVNRLGLNYLDTTFYGLMTIHINSIHAFPKDDEGFSYVKNGAIFKIAGGGYLLLNIINTLSDGDPVFGEDNLPKIGIAAGVIAVGVVLGLTHKSTYIIGKKYRLEYIAVKPSEKPS
ncbi:MAG TPA: hypothetical protein VFW07_05465 [Parafilimonas sp.]|nr:hypothetical protein [Parafilimonas sp.]